MIVINVLGSSSSGNCYLVTSPLTKEIIILDAGVSIKEIQKGLNYNFKNVVGVLITHEHGDHVKAVGSLAEYAVDIYASKGTFESRKMIGHRLHVVQALKEFKVGNFKILPFETQHDAVEPLGFLIEYVPTGERILYVTDSYYLKYKFKNINYFLVECNYIGEIVKKNIEAGIVDGKRYKRLLKSHMSLENCIKFLSCNVSSKTRKIILIHLSDSNSDEKKMISSVYNSFFIDTIVANKDLEVKLEMYDF